MAPIPGFGTAQEGSWFGCRWVREFGWERPTVAEFLKTRAEHRAERQQRTPEPRAKTSELSFSDSSPCEETSKAWVQLGRSKSNASSLHSIRAAIILRAFHDFWLLVALENLDADASRRRWSSRRHGLGRGAVNHWCGYRCGGSLIEAAGIGGCHFVLPSVEWVAQGELNMTFRTGESEPLGIVGRN